MPKPRTIGDRASINRKIHGLADHATASAMASARFGVESMRELTDREMHALYVELIEKAPRRRPRPPAKRRGPMADASGRQLWKINDMRGQVGGMDNDATFNMWAVKHLRIFKKAPAFEKLTNGEAYKIIEALKSMAGRGARRAPGEEQGK